jgi:hypothetical protein
MKNMDMMKNIKKKTALIALIVFLCVAFIAITFSGKSYKNNYSVSLRYDPKTRLLNIETQNPQNMYLTHVKGICRGNSLILITYESSASLSIRKSEKTRERFLRVPKHIEYIYYAKNEKQSLRLEEIPPLRIFETEKKKK